ncbi:MAG: FtsK/SpoIIIE domain-containing protein [Verrucomicrobiota bacterium]|nr:FtsK/SpoIIIE domain-containing protein [Verrucomicrobiota bacterium]
MRTRLGVSRGLELANGLGGAIREFSEREEAAAKQRRTRSFAAKRAFEQGCEKEKELLEAAITTAEARSTGEKKHAETRHAARAEGIELALPASKRLLSGRAEELTGKTASELQVRAVTDKVTRQQSLEKLTVMYERLHAELGQEKQNLQKLQRKSSGAMRGYPRFQKKLKPAYGESLEMGELDTSGQTPDFLERVRKGIAEGEEKLAAFRENGLARLLSFFPWWLLLVLGWGAAIYLSNFWVEGEAVWSLAGGVAGGAVLLIFVLQFTTGGGAEPAAGAVAEQIERTRRSWAVCSERIAQRFQEEQEHLVAEEAAGENRWVQADEAASKLREEGGGRIEEKYQRARARNDEMRDRIVDPLNSLHDGRLEELQQGAADRIASLQAEHDAVVGEVEATYEAARNEMEAEWTARVQSIYQEAGAMAESLAPLTPPWEQSYLEGWQPSTELHDVARFGRVSVAGNTLAEEVDLGLPDARAIEVPMALQLPHDGSLLFETDGLGRETALGALNNIILRLLATTPPGKLNFTVIDPVGLGENFAGIMHLADYEDSVINGRIWTQRGQIEEKLGELNEHIEKVIQMYLRNEYETITDYNEQAGNIAEKYHFLVIADFPSSFSETAAKRLQSIAMSGPRCGIYTLMHWDHQQTGGPAEMMPEVLRENSIGIRCEGERFLVGTNDQNGTPMEFDPAPDPEIAIDFIQKIGASSVDANRVEVPFQHVIPKEGEFWSSETTNELRVPIGRTGATKLQYLAIGKGTRQHALFAGKTGSGKSTLFHVIISNLSLWCSPDQVEFYLVDFKKGVEFKCYATARLPHARVVAIESDLEFGLSVLKRVDEELKRRGDMFRKLGVQDVAGYKKAGGSEPVPRSLLIIDEFQELFVEDDRIAQDASVLLDRIVRQGRAFGIHVLLGSQTLGGAYSMARTTMGQMVIRVALQCNESDAYLIMDDSNPAPRMLTRPGEGIYNDSAGALEANSPFQVVWLPDEERDQSLRHVLEIAEKNSYDCSAPIVFEGNSPADVGENGLLYGLLHTETVEPSFSKRSWLGSPNSIKGPTEATFNRQSGNNLIVIGQREEAALAMLAVSLVSLSAQSAKGGIRFIVCDGTTPGSSESAFLQRVVEAVPHQVEIVKNNDLPRVMGELGEEMKRRGSDEEVAANDPPVFLLIHNLQKFKKLKHEDDFDFSFDSDDAGPNPGAQLNEIVTEGTGYGLHVIATVDTCNNVNRFLSRKALSEFEMRVIFQMSQNDSAALVDSPAASNLGLHRALFYNEHEGYLETFRPYALPGNAWVEEVDKELKRLVG